MTSSSPLLLQWPDLFVLAVIAFSGVLALSRGFTREVLSLLSWGAAAFLGVFAAFQPELVQIARGYIGPETAAQLVTGVVVFLIVLLLTSLISVKIADLILRGPAGTFDRTLGLFYGMARGLFLVAVIYFFYDLFIPKDKQSEAILRARFLPIVKTVQEAGIEALPVQFQESIKNLARVTGKVQTSPAPSSSPQEKEGGADYRSGQQRTLDSIIEGTKKEEK